MKRSLAILLVLLLASSTIFLGVPIPPTAKTSALKESLTSMEKETYSSSSVALPIIGVDLDNVSIRGDIILEHDSVVHLKNSFMNESVDYYLYNNSVLILENVTVLVSYSDIHLYDNSSLIIINSNDTDHDLDIYAYDNSRVTVYDSWLIDTDFYINDDSQASVTESLIDYVRVEENAYMSVKNSTIDSSVRLYENATVEIENSNITYYVYLNDYSEFYIRNVTIGTYSAYRDISVYDNSYAYVKNCTFDDLYIYDYGHAMVVNSTMDYVRSYSPKITYIYNSTVDTISHGFIIYGSALLNSSGFFILSGTFDYNIINDTETKVNSIYNLTDYFVMPSGSMIIDNPSNYIYLVIGNGSTITINNTIPGIETIIVFDSSLTIDNSKSIDSVYAYDSSVNINKSEVSDIDLYETSIYIDNSKLEDIYGEGSTVSAHNTTIVYGIDLTETDFTANNCTITADIYLYNSHSSVNFVNTTVDNAYLDFYYVTFHAIDTNITNSNIYLENGTYTFENCWLSSSNFNIYAYADVTITNGTNPQYINLYDNSSLSLSSSVVKYIHMYGDYTYLYAYNSSMISVELIGYNATAVIEDSEIVTNLETNYDTSARLINSNATYAEYYLTIFGGTVTLSDNKITGDPSNYRSTVVADANSNVNTWHLVRIEVNSGTANIYNQTVDEIIVYGAEVDLKNDTINELTMYGHYLSVDNCTFDAAFIINTFALINGTDFSTVLSLGKVIEDYTITNGYTTGNLTYVTASIVFVFNGLFGIASSEIAQIAAGDNATVYLYDCNVTTMYQSYYFNSNGSIYMNNEPTGYYKVGIHNVTGNKINAVYPGYIINYNGTLTINGSQYLMLIGYNNSRTIITNNSIISMVLHNSSEARLNNSTLYASYFEYNMLTDNAKLFVENNSEVSYVLLYDESYLFANMTTFTGENSFTATLTMIEMYNNSSAELYNTSLGIGLFAYILSMHDNAELYAENISVFASSSPGITLYDNSRMTLKNSTLTTTGYITMLMIDDNSTVVLEDSELYNSLSGYCYVFLYDNAVLNVTNTSMYKSGGYAKVYLYEESQLLFDTLTLYTIRAYDNSTITGKALNVTYIYLYENSRLTATNPKKLRAGGIYTYDNSTLSITNATYILITLQDSSTAYIEGFVNETSSAAIYIYDSVNAIIKDSIINELSVRYFAPVQPFPKTELYNVTVDILSYAVTFHRVGTASFVDHTFNVVPSSSLFEHVVTVNCTIGVKHLLLNIKDNVMTNGSDVEIYSLYVGLVKDTTPPTIIASPLSQEFEKGIPNKLLTFTLIEDFPDIYVLERNGTVIESDFYSNGTVIVVDASALDPGYWIFTMFANDTSGNSETATATVRVYPSEAPVFISKPPDTYDMVEGSTGNVLNWTVTDRSPAYYLIYVDGDLKENSTWSSGIPIEYNIDFLEEGTHNVTIVVYDLVGNSNSHTVTVNVSAPIAPPPDRTLLLIAGVVALVIIIVIVIVLKKRKK